MLHRSRRWCGALSQCSMHAASHPCWDALAGAEIVRALDYYGVPRDLQQELVTAYMQSMPDVVDPNAP